MKKDSIISRQILRSGTSIGANIEESIVSHSVKELYTKLSISYREARETKYWLRLLMESNYINSEQFSELLADCEELIKILGKSRVTLFKRINQKK